MKKWKRNYERPTISGVCAIVEFGRLERGQGGSSSSVYSTELGSGDLSEPSYQWVLRNNLIGSERGLIDIMHMALFFPVE